MKFHTQQIGFGKYKIPALAGLSLLVSVMAVCIELQAAEYRNGLQIMQEVHRRHEWFPYVYEEQSMVMIDSKGQRDTRQARRYSRVEENGEIKFMYMFISPLEIKGVTLMAIRDPAGSTVSSIYLPAFGETFIESSGAGSDGNFLGTDFSVEDLTIEILDNYKYARLEDEKINEVDYFVVDVYPSMDAPATRFPLRRHFIRQDCFYITRTDHFDRLGRLYKQQSHYDLKHLEGDMWRAGIILMDDKKARHQSIIKINRRIFSHDYVPAEMFSKEWILANYPPIILHESEQNDIQGSEQGRSVTESESVTEEQSSL